MSTSQPPAGFETWGDYHEWHDHIEAVSREPLSERPAHLAAPATYTMQLGPVAFDIYQPSGRQTFDWLWAIPLLAAAIVAISLGSQLQAKGGSTIRKPAKPPPHPGLANSPAVDFLIGQKPEPKTARRHQTERGESYELGFDADRKEAQRQAWKAWQAQADRERRQ